MELRTPRLRLRPYAPGDFETLFRQLVLDPVVVRFWDDYADPALTEADKRTQAEHDLGSWIEEGIAAGYPTWVLEGADPAVALDREFVGVAGIFPAENPSGPSPRSAACWPRGTTVGGSPPRRCWPSSPMRTERLGIPILVAIIDEPNGPSIRFVEKCGFSLERSFLGDDGEPCGRYVRRGDAPGPP